ncbi:hybrid sensor histidine kinase/response regulator [Ancylobacter lacus]|uniref:hybrid sensor histidine kinase/response regulator n=1 Tax=Ancylobacter lacus TaxID=2579970 RepID=UPI001BCB8285|nr:hybrid sensor histidine kinase/response regulator [Ancylobacter lacus]MBS7539518.1 hybrid sensor histidine kinase/response regulator [Ancylobacter lacus]
MSPPDLSQFSMLDLFRAELDTQSLELTASLLALERNPTAAEHLEAAMRAAHSLKGAARIIELMPAVRVAHAMEECLVAAQAGRLVLRHGRIDALLKGVDLLGLIATEPPPEPSALEARIASFLLAIEQGPADAEPQPPAPQPPAEAAAETAPLISLEPPPAGPAPPADPAPAASEAPVPGGDRMIRIGAQSMTRLLGLAGESLIEARRLGPFADSLTRLKRHHGDIARALDAARAALAPDAAPGAGHALAAAAAALEQVRIELAQRLEEVEALDRRGTDLANRLYAETLESRMRPFEDGVRGYARMVRDFSRALGKKARLEIVGGATGIDRDILDQLDAPLGHLLRNAIDHGLEAPEERRAAGKPEEGVILLEASHRAGQLQIVVADDGRGVDLDRLRRIVLERHLTAQDTAARLSEAELLEFLFLPGFSMKGSVSDVSGRGVGLDAVQAMARQVRGHVAISTQAGLGTRFQLDLPLTLSVIRTLLVEIAGEAYALPLAGLFRTLRLAPQAIEQLQGRAHFALEGQRVALVAAGEVLGQGTGSLGEGEIAVAVAGEGTGAYGFAVDRFLGERELVVRPLDTRLGKIRNISAAALMEDGSPVLIVDIEDLLRSADKLAMADALRAETARAQGPAEERRKRILVVDDSLTVRELERKLLDQNGYEVDVAVDGMDGWNAIRSGAYDLVITDVDMPRMDGIEMVTLMKRDPRLRNVPVMIVSYKDREEDRRRGLDAGADYYLTKGSFHDAALTEAVTDLIGPSTAVSPPARPEH